MLNKMRRNRKGFTLIELIIVVAILAILAAIAVPNFMSARREARWGALISDATTVVHVINVYNALHPDAPIAAVGEDGAWDKVSADLSTLGDTKFDVVFSASYIGVSNDQFYVLTTINKSGNPPSPY
jgi:prepilin-type N-terminal cleavage/methylation domain-containing protein